MFLRATELKKKLLTGVGVFVAAVALVAAGFYLAFFFMTGLEFNDRLKYEAAYLRGYVTTQKRLYAGDVAGAQRNLDFLIDAHARTLSEFSYLQSSALVQDVDSVLCEVVKLRSAHPRLATSVEDPGRNAEIDRWYEEIDDYLLARGRKC
jgi:hypothetical protein